MAFGCFMPGSGLLIPPSMAIFGGRLSFRYPRPLPSARGSTPLPKPETGADPRRFRKERLYL